jgi:Rps23 Pro-64 3,4-dihydroxylase Tpa1-like proline 4-hydroxylase
MSRYPYVLLFRHNTYSKIDSFIEDNKDLLMCSIHIINDASQLNKLYNPNYHLLVTYGDTYDEYNYIAKQLPDRFSSRWFHKTDISNIDEFNHNVNYCYITNVIDNRENTRPIFSIFTTCFKSYDYIKTAYESIKNQSLIDWEWVIMDDTPEDAHFVFLKEKLAQDNRVRLYKRDKNSGNIGNVKNEAISLCRGKYILEMDHDDEIFVDCLRDAYNIFKTDEDIGFVYGDTIHLYRNGENFKYSDFISKGYGGYYSEKIKGKWVYVYNTPNINNITLSHLVCLPNHPRIWKRSVLMELESYSEFLPICDDYEILLRTCCSKYKVAKNNKAQYIQYMNDDGNNFSNIRNSEINRIGPNYISPMFYNKCGVHDKMKKLDAYEDEKYIENHSPIWKRENEYQHKKMNSRINLDYDKQYCIINDAIDDKMLVELYKNSRNDFLFLSNCMTHEEMYHKLESLGFDRMKCYSYNDCSEEELVNYFKMMYKNDNCEHEIIQNENNFIMDNIVNLNLLDTEDIKSKFTVTNPFNHIVLDNIINTTILNKALDEIKSIPDNELLSDYVYGVDNVQINKFCYRDFNKLKYMSYIKNYFESDIFIKWLEEISGINNLQKDISSEGAGIHIIKQNGKLAIHSDFNRHKTTKQYRRLNLLLYLNKDYQEEYNGHLELWNKQMTSCDQKISPLFNRIVIFKVDDDANHGHPEIWNSENSNRTSLALYYYTDDRPEHEKSEKYNAVWKTIIKPKCFIIHNNTVGGAYKFLVDLMKTYPNYEYIFIDNQQQLRSIEFNEIDLFILQNVLYTDIEITDILSVRHKYKFKLFIIVHDFQWLCQEQHKYTNDIPSAYLDDNISVSNEVKQLLSLSDKVIMNSQFTYDVYSKYFDPSNFIMSYYNDYKIQYGIKNIPKIKNECINIGIFCPLCRYKGERYVNYLKDKFECNAIQFQIVGQNIPYYKENEFYDYIRKYNINGFLLLNEWGETYAYLLTKIINSGLPLLYNNFGAFKERLDVTQENTEHYFKVYEDEYNNGINDIQDYNVLDSQFNNFVEYIHTNNGKTQEMNEDFTIITNSVYDELLLQ